MNVELAASSFMYSLPIPITLRSKDKLSTPFPPRCGVEKNIMASTLDIKSA
jgi:hypothetical protein